MSDKALVLSQVTASYGAKPVLKGLDLCVAPGERLVLLGPNGAGKTTLLKVLCGAMPAGGTVTVMGRPVAAFSRREMAQTVAFVPQVEAPAFAMTVRELVLTARLPWSSGIFESAADHDAVEKALADAECEALAGRPVTDLSGGEFQRAVIARALAQETPIVLMDEPTNHLDPLHQVEVGELVARMAALGRTVVATSHDLGWAFTHFPRAALLCEGSMAFDGSAEDLASSAELAKVYGVGFAGRGLVPVR
ncbi:MAG: ABC transporter ATP-binding protein [Fimbriimonadaceae bacterium]|nr:MAG: ABC transporter ATP-binding protein [Fimbriimonadaceae bacterium]